MSSIFGKCVNVSRGRIVSSSETMRTGWRKDLSSTMMRRVSVWGSDSGHTRRYASSSSSEAIRYTSRNEEQFQLISVLRGKLMRDRKMTVKEAFVEMDRLIKDYMNHDENDSSTPELCELAPLLSKYGAFFTELPLSAAFYWYNKRHRFGKRRHVPPSDDELRHVFNVAQLMQMADTLRLASFDGDETLYDNRDKLHSESAIVYELVRLMDRGVVVSLTTAVGGTNPEIFEERLEGLLNTIANTRSQMLEEDELDEDEDDHDDEGDLDDDLDGVTRHDSMNPMGMMNPLNGDLFVMGGQCNFLFRLNRETFHLTSVPDEEWMTSEMLSWDADASKEMLNAAMRELQAVSAKFRLPMRFVEKEAAVGALFTGDENDTSLQNYLDEVALEVRERLNVLNYPVPFNCFNGGLDVFVDVGSKQHGLMVRLF